jgi:hypothetical protein
MPWAVETVYGSLKSAAAAMLKTLIEHSARTRGSTKDGHEARALACTKTAR